MAEVLSFRECVQWCDSRGFALDEREHPARPPGRYMKLFEVPTLSRGRLELARALVDWAEPRVSLLWVTDWPLHVEDEMSLFLELRRDANSLILLAAPGLMFSEAGEDQTRLVHFVYLILAFNWEGFLLHGDRSSYIWLADEVIEVVSNDTQRLAGLQEILAGYGVAHFEK